MLSGNGGGGGGGGGGEYLHLKHFGASICCIISCYTTFLGVDVIVFCFWVYIPDYSDFSKYLSQTKKNNKHAPCWLAHWVSLFNLVNDTQVCIKSLLTIWLGTLYENAFCHIIVFKYCFWLAGSSAIIITVALLWARWRIKSPASRLFRKPFVQSQIKRNIKAPLHWPLWAEFTRHRWIPCTKGQ